MRLLGGDIYVKIKSQSLSKSYHPAVAKKQAAHMKTFTIVEANPWNHVRMHFADSDGKRSRVALRPEHGTIDQLPQRWVQEFAVAVRNLSERTGLAHLWAMAPS